MLRIADCRCYIHVHPHAPIAVFTTRNVHKFQRARRAHINEIQQPQRAINIHESTKIAEIRKKYGEKLARYLLTYFGAVDGKIPFFRRLFHSLGDIPRG